MRGFFQYSGCYENIDFHFVASHYIVIDVSKEIGYLTYVKAPRKASLSRLRQKETT